MINRKSRSRCSLSLEINLLNLIDSKIILRLKLEVGVGVSNESIIRIIIRIIMMRIKIKMMIRIFNKTNIIILIFIERAVWLEWSILVKEGPT